MRRVGHDPTTYWLKASCSANWATVSIISTYFNTMLIFKIFYMSYKLHSFYSLSSVSWATKQDILAICVAHMLQLIGTLGGIRTHTFGDFKSPASANWATRALFVLVFCVHSKRMHYYFTEHKRLYWRIEWDSNPYFLAWDARVLPVRRSMLSSINDRLLSDYFKSSWERFNALLGVVFKSCLGCSF